MTGNYVRRMKYRKARKLYATVKETALDIKDYFKEHTEAL